MIIKKGYYIFVSLFLTIFLFWGCDGISGDVVDVFNPNESIVMIDAPSQVSWSADDSTFITTISLADPSAISSMAVNVINQKGVNELNNSFALSDDGENGDELAGDGIYTASPYMLSSMANGIYNLEYVKFSAEGMGQKIASKSFLYDNGQQNYPPEISNLVMPTSVERGEDFVIHLTVTDPNGLANLQQVLFKLTRPDGTVSMNGTSQYFPMYDNGDTVGSGDEVRGDGNFSLKNSFGTTAPLGTWTFEFRAIDKAGAISNIITNSMVVE